MELDEDFWALSGGAGPQWRAVLDRRVEGALRDLGAVAGHFSRFAPRALAHYRLPDSFSAFLAAPAPERARLALFPAFDCWLQEAKTFLAEERPARDWEAHFPAFQSFSAALASATGSARTLHARLTPERRFHATGTREYFEFPRAAPGDAVAVRVRAGRIFASVRGSAGVRRLLARITPRLWVESRDPLIMRPVVVHPPASPVGRRLEDYVRVLARALARIARLDGPLCEEMGEFLRVLVPLENPKKYGSVSSSYQNLRGALGLSHSSDSLLQEETLIHEFCHQKLNLLAETDPLILPGQGGQVFYSPLRPDARRLRGLLLGAHAFVNVNRYLFRVLEGGTLQGAQRASVIRNVVRRQFHVEEMLRSVSGYASLTPFGARFVLRLWRESMLHHHHALAFPAGSLEEGRKLYLEHRARHALGDTGYFKSGGKA